MNRQRLHSILLLMVMSVVSLNICGQAIQVDFDKKVIYADSLNLPDNTTALSLLTMLPELLQRPDNSFMSNYDIQVEDMSVGSASDVALQSLQIVDILKVEVSESPVSSYHKNGQGGSINFVLRTPEILPKSGVWGSAGIVASSAKEVAPQLIVGYKKGKFMLRGLLLGELNSMTEESQTLTFKDDMFVSSSFRTHDTRFSTELARAYMQFDFSSRDQLKVNLSETFTHGKDNTLDDYDAQRNVTQHSKATNLHAHIKYQHRMTNSTFTAQLEGRYEPTSKDYSVEQLYFYDGSENTSNIAGKLEYKNTLVNMVDDHDKPKQFEMTIGSNFNATKTDEAMSIADNTIAGNVPSTLNPQNNTFYIMPYVTLKAAIRNMRFKFMGEFQHFRYDVKRLKEPYKTVSNTFTGKLMVEWHLQRMKNLRLMLDRKLERPAYSQLYPYKVFVPKQKEYVLGNPMLQPVMIHELMLDYISTHRWNSFSSLMLSAGVSLENVSDVIANVYPDQPHESGQIGYIQHYLTFKNQGHNNIASVNLMSLYTYKAFTLSFVGNLYHKFLDDGMGATNHYTYFNISLNPHFNLKDGWYGGVQLMYYSHVMQSGAQLGDNAMANMIVGKEWKRFFIFLTENVSVMGRSKDVQTSENVRTEKKYDMTLNVIGLGMKYLF